MSEPTPHRCGPTPEHVMDAQLRGDTIGTWERCAVCVEREQELLRGIFAPGPSQPGDEIRISGV